MYCNASSSCRVQSTICISENFFSDFVYSTILLSRSPPYHVAHLAAMHTHTICSDSYNQSMSQLPVVRNRMLSISIYAVSNSYSLRSIKLTLLVNIQYYTSTTCIFADILTTQQQNVHRLNCSWLTAKNKQNKTINNIVRCSGVVVPEHTGMPLR